MVININIDIDDVNMRKAYKEFCNYNMENYTSDNFDLFLENIELSDFSNILIDDTTGNKLWDKIKNDK